MSNCNPFEILCEDCKKEYVEHFLCKKCFNRINIGKRVEQNKLAFENGKREGALEQSQITFETSRKFSKLAQHTQTCEFEAPHKIANLVRWLKKEIAFAEEINLKDLSEESRIRRTGYITGLNKVLREVLGMIENG